jgi:hypothetical protein
MTEDEINKQVSKETGSMSSVSVGIELDKEALRGLRDSVKAINKESKEMARNFKDALGALKEMRKDYGLTQVNRTTEISPWGTGGGGAQQGAAGTPIVGGRAQSTQAITPAPNAVTAALSGREVLSSSFAAGVSSAEKYEGVAGKNAGGTGLRGLGQQAFNGFNSAGNFASMAGTLAKVGVQAIDERVERGRGYALAADKSTLQMQQITGMSQREVMNNLRMPLTDYKLGTNGINQLMSLQARTGINAGQQASSVEAMRTISGFSMGAEGATSIIENLADPETVNKMFMMTGMSMIGPGGKQRSAQSVIEGLAKRAGLDNKKMAESAIAPGSVTRSTLSAMGVAGDLQDQVIQYGQANVAFREKGGKGSYDPTKEADRKRMGIDDTFAMEAEETERRRGKRDEQFYRDQAGAYAKLERQTQTLTDAMAKLENAIAPIISARTGSRIAQKIIGGVASIGMGFALGGGIGAGFGALGALGSILGDPRPIGDDRDDETWGTTLAPSTTTVPPSIPSTTIPSTTIPGGTVPPPYQPTVQPLTDAERNNQIASILGPFGGLQAAGFNNREYTLLDDTATGYYNAAFNTGKAQSFGIGHPLSDRINQLIYTAASEEGIHIGINSGKREDTEQEALFLSRWDEVSSLQQSYRSGGKTYRTLKWKGKTWALKPGVDYVAPPGQSLHGLGLAADLDIRAPGAAAWLSRNKTRFGLVSGDGEPYHVQLAWTKDMSVEQFLGKTALTAEEATNPDYINSQGEHVQGQLRDHTINWNAEIQPGFGVNLRVFSEKLLKQMGIEPTQTKLMMLRAIAQKEGGGGMYNPFNVISGSGRTALTSSGKLVDRQETNMNYAGGKNREKGKPGTNVQHFDNIDEGVAFTAAHYLKNQTGLITLLRQPNPTWQQYIDLLNRNAATAAATKSWSGAPQVLQVVGKVAEDYNDAVQSGDLEGLYRNYGQLGVGTTSHIANPYSSGGSGSKTKYWDSGIGRGDPNPGSPISIPTAPMLSSSGSSGIGGSYHEGSTVTISPVIHMNGTGGSGTVSEYDLKVMAKKIAKLIEQEASINKFRSM